MKILSVLVLCTIAASIKGEISKEAMEKFKVITGACSAEVGASEADVETMMKGDPADNMETKCLRACIMKKIEVINADGKMVKENAMKIANMHAEGDAEKIKIAHEITSSCSAISVPGDHCEAAEAYKMCLVAEAKKHGVSLH